MSHIIGRHTNALQMLQCSSHADVMSLLAMLAVTFSPTPLQQNILCTIHASMLYCQLRACVPAANRCKEEEGGRIWAPSGPEDLLQRQTCATKDD